MNRITLEFDDKEIGQQYLDKQRRKGILLYGINAARLAVKIFIYVTLLITYLKDPADEVAAEE